MYHRTLKLARQPLTLRETTPLFDNIELNDGLNLRYGGVQMVGNQLRKGQAAAILSWLKQGGYAMACGFHQLTRDERCQRYALRKRGVSSRGIAQDLMCSPSTISREIRRNSGRRGYRFKQADQLACKRRHLASCRPRKFGESLAQQWSPEQIAGRLHLDDVVSVSPSWIYRHVWNDRAACGTL